MYTRKNSYLITLIFILIFAYITSCTSHMIQKDVVSKEDAIILSNNFIKKLGYNLNEYDFEITEHNKPWNNQIKKDNTSSYHTERRKKLENKVYWSVDYSVKRKESTNKKIIIKQYGGDISVYIDKKSGEILTTYFGE
jgi:hypothetical protein